MATMTCTSSNHACVGAVDAAPCCGRPSASHRRHPEIVRYRRRLKRRERQRWKREVGDRA